jgi:short-subunit dehydrogenase
MARRPPLIDNRVLITGASSGIGAQLAKQFAASGARLLLVARREDRLRAIQAEFDSTEINVLDGDITSADFRQQIVSWVDSNWSGLDVLVNNAGVGSVKPFAESDENCLREIFEVNFFAPVELTRALMPRLQDQTAPTIVNVGSVLGHFSAAGKSEYCASKFALHGFSDALYAELYAAGIHVFLVSPSTTRSEFFEQQRTVSAKTPFRFGAMSPELVAQKTIRGLQAGRREIILSAGGKFSVWLDRIAPWLMSRIQRRS